MHILLTVSDGNGGVDTDSLIVTIRDSAPPSMTLALSPGMLWPPDKKLVEIVATIGERDSCDVDLPNVELVSINSSAIDPKPGDCRADITGGEFGTDDREFQLRSDLGQARGPRTYTVNANRATDLVR